MLALTPPPDRAIPVLWQNFIRKFNVPGRLDTVPSVHSRSLVSVRFLPQTRTPLHVGAKCGRPHRNSNRALTTGTSVGFRRLYPLGATEGTSVSSLLSVSPLLFSISFLPSLAFPFVVFCFCLEPDGMTLPFFVVSPSQSAPFWPTSLPARSYSFSSSVSVVFLLPAIGLPLLIDKV